MIESVNGMAYESLADSHIPSFLETCCGLELMSALPSTKPATKGGHEAQWDGRYFLLCEGEKPALPLLELQMRRHVLYGSRLAGVDASYDRPDCSEMRAS